MGGLAESKEAEGSIPLLAVKKFHGLWQAASRVFCQNLLGILLWINHKDPAEITKDPSLYDILNSDV